MRRAVTFFLALASLAVVLTLVWQTRLAMELRREQRRVSEDLLDARFASKKKANAVANRQSELEHLRILQRELDRLRARAQARKAAATLPAREKAKLPAVPKTAAPALRQGEWKNAGSATPTDGFETALWAASAGNSSALAGALLIGYEDKAKLRTALGRMSTKDDGEVEKVVAGLALTEMRIAEMQILEALPANNPQQVKLSVRVTERDGEARDVNFNMYQTPSGWRLVVPPVAIEKYLVDLSKLPHP